MVSELLCFLSVGVAIVVLCTSKYYIFLLEQALHVCHRVLLLVKKPIYLCVYVRRGRSAGENLTTLTNKVLCIVWSVGGECSPCMPHLLRAGLL